MFLKKFRVKSNTAIRGSDRRKLRSDIMREFAAISQENASEIIPSKDPMSVMKIATHSGQNVTVFTVNETPILFQVETKLYPTVYLLWRYSDMIPVFTTWPDVFEKLSGGADLMLPGMITVKENLEQLDFQKDEVCSVALLGNRAPVAVGYTAVSFNEAREQGMRGKGVIILHSYLDQLWCQGSKCDLPMIVPTSVTNLTLENMQSNLVASEINNTNSDSSKHNAADFCLNEVNRISPESNKTPSDAMNSLTSTDSIATGVSSANDEIETGQVFNEEITAENGLEDGVTEEATTECCPVDGMDKLLETSFMQALACMKNNELPILTSSFYKNHLLSCCPQNKSLDIKKSSYKKLTKFLQIMENRGFIITKEESKGVHYIESVNWTHQDLKIFKKENSDMIKEKRENDSKTTEDNKYQPPDIKDVYAVSGSTRSFFESCGYSKNAILNCKEVRQVVTDYIKNQELASTQNKRMVKLDPVLFSVVHKKGEDNCDSMSWDEVFKRIIDRMNPCHIVTFHGQAPITRKGKLEPIDVKLEQRMGNKKVTLVHNLEYYGIDPEEFSHKLQIKAASSTSVSQLPGKSNPGQQVLIQGNQILHVSRTLQGDYQLAAKYINGLDKLKQSKNKKK